MVTQRSPSRSNMSPSGEPGRSGTEIVVAGAGEPEVVNCPAVYSTTWLAPLSTTHTSPDGSIARPVGRARAPEGNVMVTAGTGSGVVNWARVSSTTLPIFMFA